MSGRIELQLAPGCAASDHEVTIVSCRTPWPIPAAAQPVQSVVQLYKCGSSPLLLAPALNLCQTQILFVIQSPDVFHSPGSDTYVVFGEVRLWAMGARERADRAG